MDLPRGKDQYLDTLGFEKIPYQDDDPKISHNSYMQLDSMLARSYLIRRRLGFGT